MLLKWSLSYNNRPGNKAIDVIKKKIGKTKSVTVFTCPEHYHFARCTSNLITASVITAILRF